MLAAGVGTGIGLAVSGGGSNGPVNVRVVDQTSDVPSETPTPTVVATTAAPVVSPSTVTNTQPVQKAPVQQDTVAPAVTPYGGQSYAAPEGNPTNEVNGKPVD